jgi:predicted NAD/FAD-dependent oxidoreductase
LAALDGALDHVRHAPCWAALLRLAPGADAGLGVDVLRPDAGPLAQAVREASKPGRADAGHWVLHAREDWSQAMLEESPEAIAPLLLAAFLEASGLDAGVVLEVGAHRWRYARPLRGMDGAPFVPALSLALAGDAIGWRADADPGEAIEQAWRSGIAAAGHLLRQAAWRERVRLQAFTLAG